MRTTKQGFAASLALVATLAAAQDQPREKAREPAPLPLVASNRFDGDWTVRMDCPDSGDAKAFAVSLPASVLNGKLFGSSGAPGSEGTVQVEGTILPDGDAQFQARGRTSSPAVESGKPPPGTPFSYDVAAHFDTATMRGNGRRLQDRPCDFGFTRR